MDEINAALKSGSKEVLSTSGGIFVGQTDISA